MKNNRTFNTTLVLLGALSFASFPPDSRAADKEFNAIVGRISAQYQKKPMCFMGLLGFIANRFTPSGVSGLKLAIFEDLDPGQMPRGEGLDAFLQTAAAKSDYRPFVRVMSNRDKEQTFIYAREAGNRLEMLIVSLESDEAVVMKMKLNPDAMRRWMNEPVEMGKDSKHDSISHR